MSNSKEAMRNKVITMLKMQDEMNSKVDSDWVDHNREWYRAIWIECAELMDHYGGWKWWKSSTADIEQAVLEIVDIWHFGLSIRINRNRDYLQAADKIIEEWDVAGSTDDFLENVETLAAVALGEKEIAVYLIPALLSAIDKDFDDLYRAYVGKNVLNFFRQDHGYKEGRYIKSWNGLEDNVHLVEVMNTVDLNAENLKQLVYSALATRYPLASSSKV